MLGCAALVPTYSVVVTMTELHCGRFLLDLAQPRVMGIVNVTPDSFFDGGRYQHADAAIRHVHRLIDEGAHLIDIGAESSRPGAASLTVEVELERLLPVVTALRDAPVPISVDTKKPQVMRRALDAGAAMINDIGGFGTDDARNAVADRDCALCVMHMQRDPMTMQDAPHYENVVAEVRSFLVERVAALQARGVALNRIVVDPGFGFGKTVEQNFTMLKELAAFAIDGLPVLAGLSRKSMLGAPTGKAANDRLAASVAAALVAVMRGARILRVHDVAATVNALAVWQRAAADP